jgi:2-polyprenyl-3-methyl-5-hydroxy-6-metoxy-1,4-benzoquinol methylase
MTYTVPDVGTAKGILRLGNAFCDSQALLTAAELDVFTVLHDNPATEQEIRDRLRLHGRGLRDFLRLLVALGLLQDSNGRYRNTADADRYLVSGQPASVIGFLRGLRTNLYPLWGGLTETLRTGHPQATGDSFEAMLNNRQELDRYVRMMDGLIQVVGPRLVEAFDWSGYRSVLDVGGCRGNLAGQIARAHHGLTVQVFDLPQMQPVFDEYIAEQGLTGRVQFYAGDFFRDPLPSSDVLVFGHILHNWAYQQRQQLVHKAFEAVNPGGALLVHDRMLDADLSNVDNLLASIIMALVTEEGSEYPISELTELAETAGFTSVSHQSLDDNETLVCGRKA